MKENIIGVIEAKINEVKTEVEPSYCGQEEYDEWLIWHNAKLEVLEELREEVILANNTKNN